MEQNRFLATLNSLVKDAQAEKELLNQYLQSLKPRKREYYKEHVLIKNKSIYNQDNS